MWGSTMLGNPPGKIDRAVIAAREGDTRACAGSVADQIGGFGGPVYAAIESMRGARFVHDQPELAGWQVEIADAQRAKVLAPLACKTDKIDAGLLAEVSRRDLIPAIWLPTPQCAPNGNEPAGGYSWSRHRPALKNGIHVTLLAIGHPCPVSELFGAGGPELLSSTAVVDSARKENRPGKDRDRRNVSFDGVMQDPTGEAASSTAAGSARWRQGPRGVRRGRVRGGAGRRGPCCWVDGGRRVLRKRPLRPAGHVVAALAARGGDDECSQCSLAALAQVLSRLALCRASRSGRTHSGYSTFRGSSRSEGEEVEPVDDDGGRTEQADRGHHGARGG